MQSRRLNNQNYLNYFKITNFKLKLTDNPVRVSLGMMQRCDKTDVFASSKGKSALRAFPCFVGFSEKTSRHCQGHNLLLA